MHVGVDTGSLLYKGLKQPDGMYRTLPMNRYSGPPATPWENPVQSPS